MECDIVIVFMVLKFTSLLAKVGRFLFDLRRFMIDIKEIIVSLQKRKQNENKEPQIVSMVEVQQEAAKMVLEELRRLTKEKEINYHQTLNGHAFSVDGV